MHCQAASHILQLGAERKLAKHGIEHVQAMTTFVDSAILGYQKRLGGSVERTLLEKVVDPIT